MCFSTLETRGSNSFLYEISNGPLVFTNATRFPISGSMKAAAEITTPTAYIASLPEDRRATIEALHQAIWKAAPDLGAIRFLRHAGRWRLPL